MPTTQDPISTERLRFTIGRFDHYYETVNSKGSFFLGINTAIMGGLFLLLFDNGVSKLPTSFWTNALLGVAFLTSAGSILYTLLAIVPYTKRGSRTNLFFGNIASRSEEEFVRSVKEETAGEHLGDLAGQAHTLAKGLHAKFWKLRIAGILLGICFSALLVLGVIILSNTNT